MLGLNPQLQSVAEEFCASKGYPTPEFKGKGAFKETYRIISGQTLLALKLCLPGRLDLKRSDREIRAAQSLNHSCFCQLQETNIFASSSGLSCAYFIEEFLEGGTLTQRISDAKLPSDVVKRHALCLTEGLEHLRTKGYVHRDIKPDNIMFRANSEDPVLVDYGLIRDLNDVSLTATWLMQGPGTPLFAPPEQLKNEKSLISWQSDQFSLGIVLSFALMNRHPYQEDGMSDQETVSAVSQRGEPTHKFRTEATSLGCPFLIKMVRPWPIQRYQTPADLIAAIKS